MSYRGSHARPNNTIPSKRATRTRITMTSSKSWKTMFRKRSKQTSISTTSVTLITAVQQWQSRIRRGCPRSIKRWWRPTKTWWLNRWRRKVSRLSRIALALGWFKIMRTTVTSMCMITVTKWWKSWGSMTSNLIINFSWILKTKAPTTLVFQPKWTKTGRKKMSSSTAT